jgi:anaerobic selenocysteine-containing dehydrogenase
MRNPKIEFIVAQHPWLENDCLYADIILPIQHQYGSGRHCHQHPAGHPASQRHPADKAIEPIGESKSDYEVVLEVAKKLEGRAVLRRQKHSICKRRFGDNMGLEKLVPGKSFEHKKYWFCRPLKAGKMILGLRPFYE